MLPGAATAYGSRKGIGLLRILLPTRVGNQHYLL